MSRPSAAPGGRRADLHVHTHFSDGTHPPEVVVRRAIERGLAAIAITDHDTLEGLVPARAEAGRTIELVPGIELSSSTEGLELHILGYFVDPEHDGLQRRLETFRSERVSRALAMVARLKELGAPVEPDEVLALAGPGVVGRPHVAAALLKAGHVDSLDDAFRRYLGRQGRAFVARPSFGHEEAIDLIHRAGGVSVLAHPGAMLAESVILELVSEGLRGIEVWHPQHNASTTRRYRALAARCDLLETGGSDYHGASRSIEIGEVSIPVAGLIRLKEAAGVAG